MDSDRPAEAAPSKEVAAFVRFCYQRRRAGWPELYDEMCAVAGRRLYNGWGIEELADRGIGFSLFETPTLAVVAREIVREETERRIQSVRVVPVTIPTVPEPEPAAMVETLQSSGSASSASDRPEAERSEPGYVPRLRLAGAAIG